MILLLNWVWWISSVVTVAAFVWLAIGIMRYRPVPMPRQAEDLVAS